MGCRAPAPPTRKSHPSCQVSMERFFGCVPIGALGSFAFFSSVTHQDFLYQCTSAPARHTKGTNHRARFVAPPRFVYACFSCTADARLVTRTRLIMVLGAGTPSTDRNAIRPEATHFFLPFFLPVSLSARTLCWRHSKDVERGSTNSLGYGVPRKKLSVLRNEEEKKNSPPTNLHFFFRERRG